MKLFVIAGHGGSNPYDPGALGNGYEEAKLVRILANKLKEFGGDSVILGDTSKNWYKTGEISTYPFEKGTEILELHLDSWTDPKSKGGHVIIDADFNPDEYDKKLATMISTRFPGRGEIISKRNLAQTNRAQAKGVSYRLMECCFITNASDVTRFIESIDEIALDILKCFAIEPKREETPVAVVKPETYTMKLTFNPDKKSGTFVIVK